MLEADDLLTVRGYVATGLRVAILPADATPSLRTVSVPINGREARRTFGLCWNRASTTAETGALVGHMRHLVGR